MDYARLGCNSSLRLCKEFIGLFAVLRFLPYWLLVKIATGYGLGGWSGFDSRWGLGVFLFDTASRPTLGPTPSFYPMGIGGSFHGSKAAGAW